VWLSFVPGNSFVYACCPKADAEICENCFLSLCPAFEHCSFYFWQGPMKLNFHSTQGFVDWSSSRLSFLIGQEAHMPTY
jgi:hypothetical protein